MKTAICHFKKWVEGWYERYENYDSIDYFHSRANLIKESISNIDLLLSKADEKAMKGKDTDEAKVNAMFENQKVKWYTDLQKTRNLLLILQYDLEKLRDMSHRKTDEIFRLKAELSKLNETNNN